MNYDVAKSNRLPELAARITLSGIVLCLER
jgi:hypothetical protein